VLCVDEKAQVQAALDRTQPLPPLRPGQVGSPRDLFETAR
jgi:hypothetical protein